MNNFLNSCRRCLNPWFVGFIVVVIVGLIIFIPVVGVTTLIVAFPLIGCAVMCGAMVFFMGKKK